MNPESDEFDGHRHYLDEFESYDSDPGAWGTPWRAMESAVALALVLYCSIWLISISPCGVRGCDGPGGLVFLVGGFLLGAVFAAIYIAVVRKLEDDWRRRLVPTAVVVIWLLLRIINHVSKVQPELDPELGGFVVPAQERLVFAARESNAAAREVAGWSWPATIGTFRV